MSKKAAHAGLAQSLFEQYLVWNFLQGTITSMKLFGHISKEDQWVYFFPFPIYIPKQLHLTMPFTGPTYSIIFGGCFHWHNHLPWLMFFAESRGWQILLFLYRLPFLSTSLLTRAACVPLLVQNNTVAACFECPNRMYFSSFLNNFNFAKVAYFLANFL